MRPSEALLRGEFRAERLTPEQVEHYKTHLAEEHLPREQQTFEAVDALALELDDFVASIRSARPPRVSGQAGREALAVAERILAGIARHAWDRAVEPAAVPYPRIVPAPERKAG